jgi:hypothetical protein
MNIPLFNLGGGATEGDQLEAFKRRFGGIQSTINVFRKIVDPLKYLELCTEYDKDSSDLSYFPIYWKS